MKENTKKLMLVGILGSLWFFAIEKIVEFNLNIFNSSLFFMQLFWVLIISGVLTYLIVKFFNKVYISVVPSLWLIVKDLYNVLTNSLTWNQFFTATAPESLLIGIPIGISLYYLVFVRGWMKI